MARRISFLRLAAGAGCISCDSNPANTNVSSGPRAHRGKRTTGCGIARGTCQAQKSRSASVSAATSCFLEGTRISSAVCGQGAPIWTHCTRDSICRAASFALGGIALTDGSCSTARISKLRRGWPGAIAGPERPPRSNAAKESTRRPAGISPSAPWQSWQCSTSIGRTEVSKNCNCCAVGGEGGAALAELARP